MRASSSEEGRDKEAGADCPTRVLIVDDVWDNRNFLGRWLARRGSFEIVEAAGGLEALALIENQTFDLVLLDIMMPDLEGTEVVRLIRSQYSASELPVIMVTAKNESEDLAGSLKLGANDYITKPIDFEVTWARVQSQLERKRDHDLHAISRRAIEDEAGHLQRVVQTNSEALRRTNQRLAHEISHRRRSEEKLQFLAWHDPVTQLENGFAFHRRLVQMLADATSLQREPVLLLVNLDRFRTVNDLHGRAGGDRVLRDVAARLQGVVGPSVPVARLGGDEFAVLLHEEAELRRVSEIGQAILEVLSQPFELDGQELRLGASCGMARASSCGNQADVLLDASSLAMRRAKADGRGRVTMFEPYLLEAHRERSALEVELRAALWQGELEVYYQPLIRADNRELTCFEALVRWNHPSRGLLLPAVFIPIAEETGLINEIGLWVLRQACREALGWPSRLHVAVNLSPVQINHPDLLSDIRKALEETSLEPDRLELEITEAGLLGAGERTVAVLGEIRSMGVRVAIDDFGTGYSSISYLRGLAFDKLKIDRQFIEHLDRPVNGRTAIEIMVALGASCGIETTAEGVETDAEFAAVSKHGCTEIQGYYVSQPLQAADARAFIK